MKKIIIAGLIVVLAGLGFIVFGNKNNEDKKSTQTSTERANKEQGKTACELLTLEDAKNLIGDNAVKSEGSDTPNLATTESVKVDNCTYSAEGATLGDLKMLTIQVQRGDSGQVKQAYENYRDEYPGDPLPDLGDTAYFATGAKQVNVLKADYWLLIAGGSLNDDEEAIKNLEIKAAQLALEKL